MSDLIEDEIEEVPENDIDILLNSNVDKQDFPESESKKNEISKLLQSSQVGGSLNSAFMVKSGKLLSAQAGTSRKNSNSYRNMKFLLKMESDLNLNDISLDNRKNTKLPNQQKLGSKKKADTNETLRVQKSQKSVASADFSENIEDEVNNQPKLMTIEGEEVSKGKNKIVKKTMMTVLLTNHWQKMNLNKRRADKTLVFLNTYRMEPVVNVRNKESEIGYRLHQVFDSLIENHTEYNAEYTPRFLRVVAEILKKECKQFKLDRYKIVCAVIIVEKLNGQSIQVVSRILANHQTDKTFHFKHEAKQFYIICSVHFIYQE